MDADRNGYNQATECGGTTVNRLFAVALLSLFGLGLVWAADPKDDDTPKAAAARKKLETKVTVKFKEEPLKECVEELKDMVPGVSILIDTKGGVSGNTTINYEAKDMTLADVLDGMFKKNGLGYIVISGKMNAYDGSILIKQGKERGYPIKEGDKDKEKDKKDK
jgi:hypothetical protein